jgi:TRAP-type C4-dicarboxylate transport system permease small subunit
MKAYKKIMSGIAEFEKILISVDLVVVTLLTFLNVLFRKLGDWIPSFKISLAWTEEVVINLFVLLIMLGCALCAREGSLISLSLIFDRLKAGGKKVLTVIITAANILFWVLLLDTGWKKVVTQLGNGKSTPILRIPEWMFTIFLPIGAVFLILHTVEFCIDALSRKEGETA